MRVQDFQNYAALTAGREVISGAFWDTLQYTSATTLQLIFFQQALAGAVTIDVSNMRNPGQLPYPQKFLIRALRVFLKQRPESVNEVGPAAVQTGAINNIYGLMQTGALQITIGSKEYGKYPLWVFSSGGGVFGQMLVSNILIGGGFADMGGLGSPSARNVYTLAKPMLIETSQYFSVTVTWPAAVTLTRNLSLTVCLEGDLIRPVQ